MLTINLIHEKILNIIKQNYQKLDNLLCSSHTIPIPVHNFTRELQNVYYYFFLFVSEYIQTCILFRILKYILMYFKMICKNVFYSFTRSYGISY